MIDLKMIDVTKEMEKSIIVCFNKNVSPQVKENLSIQHRQQSMLSQCLRLILPILSPCQSSLLSHYLLILSISNLSMAKSAISSITSKNGMIKERNCIEKHLSKVSKPLSMTIIVAIMMMWQEGEQRAKDKWIGWWPKLKKIVCAVFDGAGRSWTLPPTVSISSILLLSP